jgi:hypothetical protein
MLALDHKLFMKKKKKYLIIVIIAIFATLYYFNSSEDVVYTDLAWKVRDEIYTVSFNVNNKTKNYVSCQASIRAYREFNRRQQKRSNRICGEKIIKIKLRPEESMKFSEVIRYYIQAQYVQC